MSKPVIICVDDEPIVLESLRRELSVAFEDDCELETAMGGNETLELVQDLIAEQSDIALVIADYLMPDLKGDEVLRQIHKLSPQTLTIMLTGQAEVEGITNAINHAQLYRYIAKPWQPADLQLTIQKALNSYLQEQQLAEYRHKLEQMVAERTRELSEALEGLTLAQAELIRAEKMAALGSLVAGVAHEINTPVGNAILAASVLENETDSFQSLCQQGALKRSSLAHYLDTAHSSSDMILGNLKQAADLIQSFKQVAVDQTSLEKRTFKVMDYLRSVLTSLEPQLKKVPHQVILEGDEFLEITSFPGAFSQIVTNFIMNSVIHAFAPGDEGKLQLNLTQSGDRLVLTYADNGRGIQPDHVAKIFDPFFTTARDRGGSGLGLHIVHNLVTQTLQGTIQCSSTVNQGTRFTVDLPMTVDNPEHSSHE